MKSPFDGFINKHVRIDLKNGGGCVGILCAIENGWLTLEESSGQRLIREDDVKEVRAEKPFNSKFLFNVRIGRISFFDPESDSGHIQERGAERDWNFSCEIVRDALLLGKLRAGQINQLVKFMPTTDFSQKGGLDVGEVKAVSHHALRTKSRPMRWIYELLSLMAFMLKNQRRRVLSKEHHGFICDFNRRKGMGQIREDGTETTWSFYGNDIAEKDLFNRIYAGELGMHVVFLGFRRSSPEKIPDARNIRIIGELNQQPSEPALPLPRTTSGRIMAYYVERGFGFVKESQSEQIWYFNRQSISADMQLQTSLMHGEINQFVTFSGTPQSTPGHDYPAIDSMHGAQAHVESTFLNINNPARQRQGETYLDARHAEQHGDFKLAEDIYKKLLLAPKDSYKPLVIKGYAHLVNRLNRANEAIDLIERNKDLFDAKSRLGMLSIFYRKASQYREAADTFKQMALNLGLSKEDEKRISYLFQGAECFCEGGDFVSARDLLSYLPAEFDKNDPRYVTTMTRINAGLKSDTSEDEKQADDAEPLKEAKDSPAEDDTTTQKQNRGFQYPELAKERLATCKYVGLQQQRLAEGNFRKSDIKSVLSLLRGSVSLPPSVMADYYLTMAKIADDIGESAMPYLYKHFLFSAVDTVFGVKATPPRALEEEVMCEIVQAFRCVGNNRFLFERLWYVAVWAFCESKELISLNGLIEKFDPGTLIQTALNKVKSNQQACDRFFQMLGIVRRNIPEEGFAFLVNALETAGWMNCEEKIAENDRYLIVEGPLADVLDLENVDEGSLIGILENLTAIGELPSALDREFCTTFANILRIAATYASQQSSFIKCTETFNHFQYMSKSMIENARRTVLSVCLLKPAVRHLTECINANYDKHKNIKPELVLNLKYDNLEEQSFVAMDGMITLRLHVSSANEAAPPVHNLQFAVIGEGAGSAPRAECMWPNEFSGIPIDVPLPSFSISDKEKTLGEFSIAVSVSYDTLLGVHCECVYPFAVKLASESTTWKIIEPNPYSDTASGSHVIKDEMFFGRVSLLSDIVAALRHPEGGQCFVLYGQKRSGKSSVLEAVCRRLVRTEEKCIISSISAQALVVKGSKGSLLARFAIMLASRLKAEFTDHRIPLSDDFPTTTEIYDNPMDAIERFVRAIQGEGFFWIVAIDEFTSIHQESTDVVDSFMHNWKAMLQAHFFNALIVGQDTMPKFMDEHPNDFCVSHNIRLSYLSKEECCELASKPIELNGETRYLENSLGKIYDWTLGSPYLVQKFCYRLVKRLNSNKRTYVVDADIDDVAKSMFSGRERMPEIEFDSFVTAGDESWTDFDKNTLKRVLIAVAKESRITGWAPIDSIVREDDDGAVSITADVVEDLVKRDALERFEGKLKVPVKLFAEWLRTNM